MEGGPRPVEGGRTAEDGGGGDEVRDEVESGLSGQPQHEGGHVYSQPHAQPVPLTPPPAVGQADGAGLGGQRHVVVEHGHLVPDGVGVVHFPPAAASEQHPVATGPAANSLHQVPAPPPVGAPAPIQQQQLPHLESVYQPGAAGPGAPPSGVEPGHQPVRAATAMMLFHVLLSPRLRDCHPRMAVLVGSAPVNMPVVRGDASFWTVVGGDLAGAFDLVSSHPNSFHFHTTLVAVPQPPFRYCVTVESRDGRVKTYPSQLFRRCDFFPVTGAVYDEFAWSASTRGPFAVISQLHLNLQDGVIVSAGAISSAWPISLRRWFQLESLHQQRFDKLKVAVLYVLQTLVTLAQSDQNYATAAWSLPAPLPSRHQVPQGDDWIGFIPVRRDMDPHCVVMRHICARQRVVHGSELSFMKKVKDVQEMVSRDVDGYRSIMCALSNQAPSVPALLYLLTIPLDDGTHRISPIQVPEVYNAIHHHLAWFLKRPGEMTRYFEHWATHLKKRASKGFIAAAAPDAFLHCFRDAVRFKCKEGHRRRHQGGLGLTWEGCWVPGVREDAGEVEAQQIRDECSAALPTLLAKCPEFFTMDLMLIFADRPFLRPFEVSLWSALSRHPDFSRHALDFVRNRLRSCQGSADIFEALKAIVTIQPLMASPHVVAVISEVAVERLSTVPNMELLQAIKHFPPELDDLAGVVTGYASEVLVVQCIAREAGGARLSMGATHAFSWLCPDGVCPTPMCERLVVSVLNHLTDAPPFLELLRVPEVWGMLLQMQNAPRVSRHTVVAKAKTSITTVSTSLQNRSVSLALLTELSKVDIGRLGTLFQSAGLTAPVAKLLQDLNEARGVFDEQCLRFRSFLYDFCSIGGVDFPNLKDCKDVLQRLQEQAASLPLNRVCTLEYFGALRELHEQVEKWWRVGRHSRAYARILLQLTDEARKAAEENPSVRQFGDRIAGAARDRYGEELERLNHADMETRLFNVSMFWEEVHFNEVENELKLAKELTDVTISEGAKLCLVNCCRFFAIRPVVQATFNALISFGVLPAPPPPPPQAQVEEGDLPPPPPPPPVPPAGADPLWGALCVLVFPSATLQQLDTYGPVVSRHCRPLPDQPRDALMAVCGAEPGSREVVQLLQRHLNDDLRMLVDSLDDHSDQVLSETTIADLVSVHTVLRPLLSTRFNDAAVFVGALLQVLPNLEGGRVRNCAANLYALSNLFDIVTADRAERVAETVVRVAGQSALSFSFTRDEEDQCRVSLLCTGGVLDAEAMDSLRSRGLLLSNVGDRLIRGQTYGAEAMKAMVEQVTDTISVAMDVRNLYTWLHCHGHPTYRCFELKVTDSSLVNHRLDLKRLQKWWDGFLQHMRERHFYLNLFHSRQLWLLLDTLSGRIPDVGPLTDCLKYYFAQVTADDVSRLKLHGCMGREPRKGWNVEAVLDSAGKELSRALSRLRSTVVDLGGRCPAVASVTSRETFVGVVREEALVPGAIMALFATRDHVPLAHQVLFCTYNTPWDEIKCLVNRSILRSTHNLQPELSVVANFHLLPYDVQVELVEHIRKLEQKITGDFYLALLCVHQEGMPMSGRCVWDAFTSSRREVPVLPTDDMRQALIAPCGGVTVVRSRHPGEGKSRYINLTAAADGREVARAPLGGAVDSTQVIERLWRANAEAGGALHLDITPFGWDSSPLNQFLFSILVLRAVHDTRDRRYFLPDVRVFVEVSNTVGDTMYEQLPFLHALPTTTVEWSLDELDVFEADAGRDVQVVCNHLRLLQLRLADEEVYTRGGRTAPVPADECRQLLRELYLEHPLREHEAPSFSLLVNFVGFLSCQLRKFSRSPWFMLESLRFSGIPETVRIDMLGGLHEVALEFTRRSPSSRAQTDAVRGAVTAASAHANMWDKVNHLVVAFDSNCSISVAYRDVNQVPDHIKTLYRTNTPGHADLPDFNALPRHEIVEILDSLVRPVGGQVVPVDESYVFTPDCFLKMVITFLKIRSRIPVVIMGETGCGKTKLIRTLADRSGAQFMNMNVHAGTTEDDIVRFVCRAEETARRREEEMIQLMAAGALRDVEDVEEHCQVWFFFDEVNACEHLGLMKEVICDRRLLGRPIYPNAIPLAACNPYRLVDESAVAPVGLQYGEVAQQRDGEDEAAVVRAAAPAISRSLVYRVNPLPEAMWDYVWDFGNLSSHDERLYVNKMAEDKLGGFDHNLVSRLLCSSQAFIRAEDKNWAVSLRDVARCVGLIHWFDQNLRQRPTARARTTPATMTYGRSAYGVSGYGFVQPQVGFGGFGPLFGGAQPPGVYGQATRLAAPARPQTETQVRAVVLGLALCYHCRLPNAERRQGYRDIVEREMELNDGEFEQILIDEQMDYVTRMTCSLLLFARHRPLLARLPPGTCLNSALLENVFVLLVCILNRIPVFVVGKPGCSKTLSMQLIFNNLKGRDSDDELFKRLPALYVVGYQGSPRSESAGIRQAFDRAMRYDKEGVIPVVLLDEVGLAEISPFNPLKVLHSLLEVSNSDDGGVHITFFEQDPPYAGRCAVVGISNWALDAAKMNRAVHLCRPDPTLRDLMQTGRCINTLSACPSDAEVEARIDALAEAYQRYYESQRIPNFHGLRDFYALIKQLSRTGHASLGVDALVNDLCRNFGGLPDQTDAIVRHFLGVLGVMEVGVRMPLVTELIRQNLGDMNARHLMLLTHRDSAVNLLFDRPEFGISAGDTVVLYGSEYPADVSEEYTYRTLMKIVLCMETGKRVVMLNLGPIYGSLYDMLNQAYVEIGGRKYCRVALGSFSRGRCVVHDEFRCILVIDKDEAVKFDPPLLNRFEKQFLTYEHITPPDLRQVADHLWEWMRLISHVPTITSDLSPSTEVFQPSDMFVAVPREALLSLVLTVAEEVEDQVEGPEDDAMSMIIRGGKEALMWLCRYDAALRSHRSLARDREEFQNVFLRQQVHGDLAGVLQYGMDNGWDTPTGTAVVRSPMGTRRHRGLEGVQLIVFTHASIFSDVTGCLSEGGFSPVVQKLHAFTAERELRDFVEGFFTSPSNTLVIQVDVDQDSYQASLANPALCTTVACAVHMLAEVLDREHSTPTASLRDQIGAEALCDTGAPVPKSPGRSLPLLHEPMEDGDDRLPLSSVAAYIERHLEEMLEHLLWRAFGSFAYLRSEGAGTGVGDRVRSLVSFIAQDVGLVQLIRRRVMASLAPPTAESATESPSLEDAARDQWQLRVACSPHSGGSSLEESLLHHVFVVALPAVVKLFDLVSSFCTDVLGQITTVFGVERCSAMHCYIHNQSIRPLWMEMANDAAFCPPATVQESRDHPGLIVKPLRFPFSETLYRFIQRSRHSWLLPGVQTGGDAHAVQFRELTMRLSDQIFEFSPMLQWFQLSRLFKLYLSDVCLLYLDEMRGGKDTMQVVRLVEMIVRSWVAWDIPHLPAVDVDHTFSTNVAALHVVLWLHHEAINAAIEMASLVPLSEALPSTRDVHELLLGLVDRAIKGIMPDSPSAIQTAGGVQQWRVKAERAVAAAVHMVRVSPQAAIDQRLRSLVFNLQLLSCWAEALHNEELEEAVASKMLVLLYRDVLARRRLGAPRDILKALWDFIAPLEQPREHSGIGRFVRGLFGMLRSWCPADASPETRALFLSRSITLLCVNEIPTEEFAQVLLRLLWERTQPPGASPGERPPDADLSVGPPIGAALFAPIIRRVVRWCSVHELREYLRSNSTASPMVRCLEKATKDAVRAANSLDCGFTTLVSDAYEDVSFDVPLAPDAALALLRVSFHVHTVETNPKPLRHVLAIAFIRPFLGQAARAIESCAADLAFTL